MPTNKVSAATAASDIRDHATPDIRDHAAPASSSRRDFLKNAGLTTIALTLGIRFPALAADATAGLPDIVNAGSIPEGIELMTWIAIDKAGKVTIFNHRAEMGQGAFQVVPQMIAEELEVDLGQVNIVFAPGSQTKYGSQITGGSSTVRGSYRQLLRIGASAREMLITTAAKKWGVPQSECYAEKGQVIHRPTGKKFSYGDLVEDAAKLDPPKNPPQKERKDYKVIGQPLPRQDTPLKTNGTAIFGLDKKLPGMLYAVVERSPRILGKVKGFDDSAAKALPGVRQVLKVQRTVFARLQEGVAVVADTLWTAMQARKLLKIDWDDTGFEHLDSQTLYARMHADLDKPGLNDRSAGDFDTVFKDADIKVEAVYEAPYESHSCMEPLNCIANVKGNSIEIWGPIQGPDWIQSDLSRRMGVPVENVVVNMTFLGGGFGRKAFLDYPHEAAVISKAVGAPVQVVWTREDDMTQGPFRPGGVYGCKAGLSKGGFVRAFQTKTAIQNMDQQGEGADRHAYNSSTLEGLCKPWLDTIPNYHFCDIPTESPIPVMWWRSVYASTNGFAYESFIDELAHAAGKDPLEFRRQHLDDDRYRALIDKLREISGWDSRVKTPAADAAGKSGDPNAAASNHDPNAAAPNHDPNSAVKTEGWGVAITECFSSIVGEVVRVSRHPDGKVRVDKVIALMDCGWYVNPDIIRQQVEGSIVMALGAATKHDTHFKDGMAVEKNFDTYHMPRINEIPEIEVHIMENDEKAGGVGEPGLPPLAPALCNAIFDLSGKRIRRLPFNLDEI